MNITRNEMLDALAANANDIIAARMTLEGFLLADSTRRDLELAIASSADHAMWLVTTDQFVVTDLPQTPITTPRITKANTVAEGMYTVRVLPRGEFIRKKQDAKKTYVRGAYDPASKRYELLDADDANRTCWIKGDALVFAGFTY